MAINHSIFVKENEQEPKQYKIIVLGDSLIKADFLESVIDDPSEGINHLNDDIYYMYRTHNENKFLIYEHKNGLPNTFIEAFYQNADAALIIINVADKNSISKLETYLCEIIKNSNKMLPLSVIGINLGNSKVIADENILEILYDIGDCSVHRVPYYVINNEKLQNINMIFDNLIAMIKCKNSDKCIRTPCQLRKWCEINQMYKEEI